jgi:hypothetical protein
MARFPSAARASTRRETVGSQATDPSTAGSARLGSARLGSQHAYVGQAVPAQGHRESDIQQELAWIVHRSGFPPRRQRRRCRLIQTGLMNRLHQQYTAGLGHHCTAVVLNADTG